MAVLGRQAILQAIDDALIAITPFNADHVGPASVDLTLGSTFRVFRKVHEVIEVRDHTDYRECTDKLEIPEGGHILIMPGETVLGITRERIRRRGAQTEASTVLTRSARQGLDSEAAQAVEHQEAGRLFRGLS